MTITYRIDARERIVFLTTSGVSSFEEWEAAMLEILADPSYEPGFNFLSDRRQQTDVPPTAFAKAAAGFLKRHSGEMGRFRWAAVSSKDAIYGMQRMFSIIAEDGGVEANAFRSFDEARLWLEGKS